MALRCVALVAPAAAASAERGGACGGGRAPSQEVRQADLHEPAGWVHISLRQGDVATGEPLHAYFVQLAILSNHQNGRDSHVRQVHVFGPQPCAPAPQPTPRVAPR